MAGEFLKSKGIDIDKTMAEIQRAGEGNGLDSTSFLIQDVILPDSPSGSRSTLAIKNRTVEAIQDFEQAASHDTHEVNGRGALLAPSLCHPHIHIDKAYLLSHPKYADLQVEKGDFAEAMALTGKAKAQFEHADLIERGQRLVDESITAGVTHMRAFVEVDAGVQTKCLDAGIQLQQRVAQSQDCHIQLCAFAQLPLFSSAQDDEDGSVIRSLMKAAALRPTVDVIGSTPYVESDREKMKQNVEFMVDLSIEHNLHLDFHLDYNLDAKTEPLIWHVLECLLNKQWKQRTQSRTIVLGHCTRLTLFSSEEWERLAKAIVESELPIHFVGLPTSDLFMMRTGRQPEVRGTLNVPDLIKTYGLNACIGVNNIGNAFTPQGSADPLSLASQGIGIYQAGTKTDAELLFECVSTRAKKAIGLNSRKTNGVGLKVQQGDTADFVLFTRPRSPKQWWHAKQSVSDAVYLYDHCRARRVIFDGKLVEI